MSPRPRVVAVTGGLLTEAPDLSSCHALAEIGFANSAEELAQRIPEADALFIWDYRFADLDPLLARASRLRWIHAASVGVDPLLSPGLRTSGIQLTNSRGVFDAAIAEYVAMLLLAQAKDLLVTRRLQAATRWQHRVTGMLAGRRAVVVGTGSIGRAIAARLIDLDLSVDLVGRTPARDERFGLVVGSDQLPDVCVGAHYLVVAAPLTAATHHLVNAEVLAGLGAHGYLVNVARGGLVDTEALLAALTAGRLAGAALDTFEVEPLPTDSPLWNLPNVIVSPHMSGDFDGFDDALVRVFQNNLENFVSGRELENVVDYEFGYVRV